MSSQSARTPPAGLPVKFVRQMSSRVSLSFKKQYGDRWALDGLGEKTVNAKADVTLSPKERWWRAFVRCDPRRHLAEYFRAGDERGPYGYLRALNARPSEGNASRFFSVWRPTSIHAMRMLFEGTAVGKALNIKGKSALSGPLTGFVPFMQIDSEADKKRVRISPPDARIHIFYTSWALREVARNELLMVLSELQEEVARMDVELDKNKSSMTDDLLSMLNGDMAGETDDDWGGLIFKSVEYADAGRDLAFRLMQIRCVDPTVKEVDTFASTGIYGLDVPERLLWEAYVTRQDISPAPGMETGRASEPAFQDLNLQALRDRKKPPPVALWQHDSENPMNPRTLLMAHEEKVHRAAAHEAHPRRRPPPAANPLVLTLPCCGARCLAIAAICHGLSVNSPPPLCSPSRQNT